MRKIFKKILCTLLVVVMCLTAAPLDGFIGVEWPELPEINFGEWFSNIASAKTIASSGMCGENVTYTYNATTGELVVSGVGAMTNYESYNASPFYDSNIKSIIVKKGVTTIGSNAFRECEILESIVIADSVITIGDYAFLGCLKLVDIIMPSSVIEIGISAFGGCESTKNITLSNKLANISRSAFSGCYNLEEVIIPDSVTSIDDNAFYNCENLKRVIIGNNVVAIGELAFYNCINLTEVSLPNSLLSIGKEAFYYCWNLKEIDIPDGVQRIGINSFNQTAIKKDNSNWSDNVLYIGNHLIEAKETVTGSYEIKNGTKSIAEWAFKRCETLEKIVIPDSVTSIGEYAFADLKNLVDVTIGEGVSKIGAGAFNDCSSIENIEIPDSVKIIEDFTFENCSSLTNLILGDGVVEIGKEAFYNCSSLKYLNIPDSVTLIGTYAFTACTELTDVKIGDNTSIVGYASFNGCDSLKSVYFGNKVSLIAAYSFGSCDSLEVIEIPDSVITIGEGAFINCKALSTLVIGNGVKEINNQAFYNCSSLKNLKIPVSAEIMAEKAFSGCTSLENIVITKGDGKGVEYTTSTYKYTPWYIARNNNLNITINNGVETIGSRTFYYSIGLKKIIVPSSVNKLGDYSFYQCTNLESAIVYSASIGNYAFALCKNLKDITMGSKVSNICDNAFEYCTGLASVNIGNGVKLIGSRAYNGCSNLQTLTIPNSVESIGDSAFSFCTKLEYVKIGNNVITINKGAFYGCSGLKTVIISSGVITICDNVFSNCNSLVSITIPDSVTTIGKSAFEECTSLTSITIPNDLTIISEKTFYNCTSLKSVTIPDIVTSIYDYAFYNCKSLTDVYYEGSEAEWKKITIGSDNTYLTNANIHYNSDNPGGSGDGTPIYSENFKFSRASYTVNLGKNFFADNSFISLVYKADKETIANFNEYSIEFSVADDRIIKLDPTLRREPGVANTITNVYCTVYGLKLGSTILTAKLPDGTIASCEIKVIPANELKFSISDVGNYYQADRIFFDRFGNNLGDCISVDYELENNLVPGCNYENIVEIDKEDFELKNVKVIFEIANDSFAFKENNAKKYVKEYSNIKFEEVKKEMLNVICTDTNIIDNIEAAELSIKYTIYFDDGITGENIEKASDKISFTVQSYQYKYMSEHISAINNKKEFGEILSNSFARQMKGLENTKDYVWSEIMSKSLIDNAVSLFIDFDEVNGYEIVLADILSMLNENNQEKSVESYGGVLLESFSALWDCLVDFYGSAHITNVHLELGGKAGEFGLKEVISVLSGETTSGAAFDAVNELLKNSKLIGNLQEALKYGNIAGKVLSFVGVAIDSYEGIQKAFVISSACEAYDEMLKSNRFIFELLQISAAENDNAALAEAVSNYITYDNTAVIENFAEGLAKSMTTGAGSLVQYGVKYLSDKLAENTANKIASVFGSALSGVFAGFELGKLVSNLLCNSKDYAQASCAVVAAGYISESLFDVIVDLQMKSAEVSDNKNAYEIACNLDFALNMYKVIETITYDKTVNALKAESSSVIAGFLSDARQEQYGKTIADIILKKSAIKDINCHNTKLAEIYSKIIAFGYNNTESNNVIKTKYKVLCVQCPVDVLVTNSKGEVVAQIINDKIVSQIEGIEIVVCEHEKYICVPDTDEYNIIITATDAGKMDYTVFEYDENGDNIREVEYSNIPLYNGQKFTGKVDKLNLAKSDSYNLTTDSKTIYADKDEYLLSEGHKYTASIINATCTENGKRVYTCTCGDTYTETIEAIGHDFDGSECKNCDYDKADDCSCKCHKKGITKFFFKIGLFFQKIFKKNKVCKCGINHY